MHNSKTSEKKTPKLNDDTMQPWQYRLNTWLKSFYNKKATFYDFHGLRSDTHFYHTVTTSRK